MFRGKPVFIAAYVLLVSALVACGATSSPTVAPTIAPTIASATNPIAAPTVKPAATATVAATSAVTTTVPVANRKNHDDAKDYTWDASQVIAIKLQGNSISAGGAGVTVQGNTATITAPGTYQLSGTLADGQIIVNATGKGTVRLILNGVDLHSSTSAPIYVMSADKTVIVLADNTRNTVTDAKTYTLAPNTDEPNAAIFSKGDLTIFGNGALTVDGNFNDGIASKDGLIIASGNITVRAVDDGIRGKDYLIVKNGTITVNAQGDGLKSDDADDAARGYISIANGAINITAKRDAIQAHTDILITNGKFNLVTGGGSNARLDANTSAKGIKVIATAQIDGGTFTIDSADDAIHSNNHILINGGVFTLATGDDAVHGDATVKIVNGAINITKSYEGIESAVITINGGEIRVVSSDDGINGAGGDGGGMPVPGFRGAPGMPPGQGSAAASKYWLYINGGYIVVDSGGDGIDINGSVEMTNGTVIVNGPTVRMNSAVDYDGAFKMTGGFLVAVGSSGMAQTPGESSTQSALLLNLTTVQPAGALVQIRSADGKDVLTFKPTKEYQSIAFSSPALVQGATYDVYLGGSSTGTMKDGLYQGGATTLGAKNTTFTIAGIVTRIGAPTRFR
ncbi:MAG: carbohydrate-binding domain-containing protein [Chloroflexi bacterium]|nr:carbohydrate-binding domain-containing protein [Chloroflexota bacterium]